AAAARNPTPSAGAPAPDHADPAHSSDARSDTSPCSSACPSGTASGLHDGKAGRPAQCNDPWYVSFSRSLRGLSGVFPPERSGGLHLHDRFGPEFSARTPLVAPHAAAPGQSAPQRRAALHPAYKYDTPAPSSPPEPTHTADSSDAPLFRRAAAVVRNRSHIPDRADLQPRRRQRLDRRLPPAPRTLHPDVNPLHPEVNSFAPGLLRRDRRRERRRLLRALEA